MLMKGIVQYAIVMKVESSSFALRWGSYKSYQNIKQMEMIVLSSFMYHILELSKLIKKQFTCFTKYNLDFTILYE